MKKLLAGLVFAAIITPLLLAGYTASAAPDTILLYDFESYEDGGIEDIGLGEVRSEYKPKFAGVVSGEFSAGGEGKSFQVIVGEWRMGDDWHVIDINVPEEKSDWSGYNWFCFYVNNTQAFSGILGMQVFFQDGEGQYWGWKTVTKGGHSFQFWNEENGHFMRLDNTDWGGMGFGNWFSGYIQMTIDPDFFFRILGEGTNSFDFSNVKTIHLRIGGQTGGREDDEYYFDNFLVCNEFEVDPETAEVFVDGAAVDTLFAGADLVPYPPPGITLPAETPPDETPLPEETPTEEESAPPEESPPPEVTASPETAPSTEVTPTPQEPPQPSAPQQPANRNALYIVIIVVVIAAAVICIIFARKNIKPKTPGGPSK